MLARREHSHLAFGDPWSAHCVLLLSALVWTRGGRPSGSLNSSTQDPKGLGSSLDSHVDFFRDCWKIPLHLYFGSPHLADNCCCQLSTVSHMNVNMLAYKSPPEGGSGGRGNVSSRAGGGLGPAVKELGRLGGSPGRLPVLAFPGGTAAGGRKRAGWTGKPGQWQDLEYHAREVGLCSEDQRF